MNPIFNEYLNFLRDTTKQELPDFECMGGDINSGCPLSFKYSVSGGDTND